MTRVFNTNHYKPKKTDEFLFDTNVWIYIIVPGLSYDQRLEQSYSDFFAKIRNSNAKILTSFLIISEFVNKFLRHEFNLYNQKNETNISYREFKSKAEYEKSYKYIIGLVNNVIIKNSELVDIPNEIIDLDAEVYNYNKNCDLNDNYIVELAKYYECYLVSSDKYMASVTADIDVLHA